jgi:hypothetical protein
VVYQRTMDRRGDVGEFMEPGDLSPEPTPLNKFKIVVHLTALTGEAAFKGPALTRRLADLWLSECLQCLQQQSILRTGNAKIELLSPNSA